MVLDEKLYDFDIALSYASEDEIPVHILRDYLRNKSNLSIYDYQENKKLSIFEYTPEVMKKIYSNKKTIVIMFLSENYIHKEFTDFESQFACQHMMRDKRLIVIKFDQATNAWLPDVKDYISLYGDKKNDIKEIQKIGNIILDALSLYRPESIEKFFIRVKNEISENLPLYSINIENDKITISNDISILIIYYENDNIFLSEKCSSTEINPMPLIKITIKEHSYSMLCTIPQINLNFTDSLSADATIIKLNEIILELLKS